MIRRNTCMVMMMVKVRVRVRLKVKVKVKGGSRKPMTANKCAIRVLAVRLTDKRQPDSVKSAEGTAYPQIRGVHSVGMGVGMGIGVWVVVVRVYFIRASTYRD